MAVKEKKSVCSVFIRDITIQGKPDCMTIQIDPIAVLNRQRMPSVDSTRSLRLLRTKMGVKQIDVIRLLNHLIDDLDEVYKDTLEYYDL